MNGTVLAYHAVGSCELEHDPYQLYVSSESFVAQMEFLKRHRDVVSLEELVRAPRRDKVALTFDDAYAVLLTEALPVLQRLGLPSTIFVPTAFIGGTNAWLEPSEGDFRIMDRAQLYEAMRLGASLESHGHAHIDMEVASFEEARADLDAAASELGDITGRRPSFFAYPFGRVGDESERAVAASGLQTAFTIDTPHRGPLRFGRVPVTRWDGDRTFRLKTSGLWLQLRRSRLGEAAGGLGGWLLRPRKRLGDATGRYRR